MSTPRRPGRPATGRTVQKFTTTLPAVTVADLETLAARWHTSIAGVIIILSRHVLHGDPLPSDADAAPDADALAA